MTDLNLNVAAAPELRTAVSSVTAPGARPDAGIAGSAGLADNPFAALLSGFLQGTQPQTPAAVAIPADPGLEPAPDAQGDSPAELPELLGLPGSTAPRPEPAATTPATGASTGKSLPTTGNGLPVELPAATRPVRTPEPGADPVPGTTSAPEGRARISLSDLALSRPLEALATSIPATTAPPVPPAAPASADRTVQSRNTRTLAAATPAGSLPLLAVTQGGNQTLDQIPGAGPLTLGAAEAGLRLNTMDLLRSAVATTGGAELAAGQLAAFAASTDGSASGTAATPTGTISGATGQNSALAGGLGNTILPPLQPLAGSQSFAGGLADRLLTLAGPGTHTARLKLHPDSLGELNVEIKIDDGNAQVWFGTTSSQARDAIEASLPQLRQLFADQGLALTRTDVDGSSGQTGQQNFDQQRRMAPERPFAADRPWQAGARAASSALAALVPAPRPSNRMVDAWA